MSSTYEISGEAGKKLGPARQTLEALGIENPRVRLASLDEDELTFTQTFQSPQDAGVDGFDLGQRVELWHGATRVFSGTYLYSEPDDSGEGFQVSRKVVGPWWWMRQTPLTGEVATTDGSGTTTQRAVLVLPTGDLRAHITTLLERAIALGCPVQIGEVAESYEIPQITFRNKSVTDALADLMSRLPDGVVEIDYSATGLPAVNVHRRGSMPARSLERGQPPLVSTAVRPRLELRPREVRVVYSSYDQNNRRILSEQIAGAPGGALPDRQIVASSGDELGRLPDDGIDHWNPAGKGTVESVLNAGIPYASRMTVGPASLWLYQSITTGLGTPSNDKFWLNVGPPEVETLDGSALPAGYGLVFSDLPDWLIEEHGLDVVDVNISGSMYAHWDTPLNPPAWTQRVAWTETISGYTRNVYNNNGYNQPEHYDRTYAKVTFTTTGKAVSGWSLPESIQRRYNFVQPPAGFANNLLAAQSWTPYQGRIVLTDQDVPVIRPLSQVYNITGSLPEYAKIRALPSSADLDISSGTATITLGTPARQSLKGMVERMRQSDDDNIVSA